MLELWHQTFIDAGARFAGVLDPMEAT
jgi:hypothetical protein